MYVSIMYVYVLTSKIYVIYDKYTLLIVSLWCMIVNVNFVLNLFCILGDMIDAHAIGKYNLINAELCRCNIIGMSPIVLILKNF